MSELAFAVDPLSPDAIRPLETPLGAHGKVKRTLLDGASTNPQSPTPERWAAVERARRAEEALYQVYYRNSLDVLDFDTEIDTAVLGDGCYKVLWDAQRRQVRVTAPDVQGLYAWWLPDDIGTIWRVASSYQLASEDIDLLYGAGLMDGRLSDTRRKSTVTEVWTTDQFELWIDSRLARSSVNPYGFIPFVIFPNIRVPKQFWGVSDLAAIQEPARELNRALSALSNILELSGNPIAVLENVEEAEDIAVAPGAVWEIPERARAYLLDLLSGGGVGLHVEYINLIYRTIHDLGEAPRTAFGDNQRNLSGVALEVEMQPLLQKVKRKRLIRSAAYRKRNEMILRILSQQGQGDFAPYQSRVIWGPVTPKDRGAEVTVEAARVASALSSRRRAMDNLGVPDPEAELAAWLEEEAAIGALGGEKEKRGKGEKDL
ncbi:MAG: phage portal protein [Chloroflexota bacterium]|nr:MAG: phage portal protein [Chloroflexota bacterium]